MGDVGDDFKAQKEVMRERKDRLGVPCATCKAKLPKAHPKILLPGQRCWCGYRDPRPNQSHEVWNKVGVEMNQSTDALAPCPWCAAGKTEIKHNGKVWTGQRFSEPTSVSVQHWCEPEKGQPSRMIERVGRDEASAIAAWNHRAVPASPASQPQHQPDRLADAGKAIEGERDIGMPCPTASPEPASPDETPATGARK